MPRLSRSDWNKTPYAGSGARETEGSIAKLMAKYGVTCHQWTHGRGPNRRPAVMYRFELADKTYRIMIESLEADASAEELMVQAKRVIFHYVKTTVELASIFMPLEKVLFSFLELPDKTTMFESAEPYLKKLKSPDFERLMLPAPEVED